MELTFKAMFSILQSHLHQVEVNKYKYLGILLFTPFYLLCEVIALFDLPANMYTIQSRVKNIMHTGDPPPCNIWANFSWIIDPDIL